MSSISVLTGKTSESDTVKRWPQMSQEMSFYGLEAECSPKTHFKGLVPRAGYHCGVEAFKSWA